MAINPLDTKEKSQFEELDLSKLVKGIFSFAQKVVFSLLRFFFAFFDNIFSHVRLILVFILVGCILGLGYFYITKPYYESNMTLNSDYFKGELLDNAIQNLNDVCKEGNVKVLSKLLNISPQRAQKIRSIKINPLISQNYRMLVDLYSSDEKYQGKLDSLLLYNNQSTFQLTVEIYDTAALQGLDSILVNYIKENDFVKKRIEVDRANLVSLRDKLSQESLKLDTLKRSIASSIKSSGDAGRTGTNNVILGERNVNPIDVYREDLQIYNRRQEVEKQLVLNPEIEIVDRFIPYTEPKSGSIITNMAKGAIGGLIIALLFVLYIMLREGLTRLRYSLVEEG